jgi:hypothetical protein
MTVISKDSLKCKDQMDILKKEGISRIGNQDISYQAIKVSTHTGKSCESKSKQAKPLQSKSKIIQKGISQPTKILRTIPFLTKHKI